MDIPITRREVFNNLIRFKNNLLDIEEKNEVPIHGERNYTILVNRHTGDIRFDMNLEVLRRQEPDWEVAHLLAKDQNNTVHFQLTDADGSILKPTDLEPLAERILAETLDVLNLLASLSTSFPEELPENTILKNLSDLHISAIPTPIESMPNWEGTISRVEAERMLSKKPQGSYLFRTGETILKGISESLSFVNKTTVSIYVLSFVNEEGNIAEHLLLQTQWGWTINRDESDLSNYEYHVTLFALIRSLKLKEPI